MENRRQERINLIFYLPVKNAEDESLIGRIIDLTTEGMMLICENSIPAHEEFKCILDNPDEEKTSREINMTIVSRWTKPAENESYFYTGFRISEISPRDRSLIESIMKWYNFSG